MAQDILKLNEESFEQIKKHLSQYPAAIKEEYDRAVEKISALSGSWNDEDYQTLLTALKGMQSKIDDLGNSTGQLITKAEYKQEMIRARKNINM